MNNLLTFGDCLGFLENGDAHLLGANGFHSTGRIWRRCNQNRWLSKFSTKLNATPRWSEPGRWQGIASRLAPLIELPETPVDALPSPQKLAAHGFLAANPGWGTYWQNTTPESPFRHELIHYLSLELGGPRAFGGWDFYPPELLLFTGGLAPLMNLNHPHFLGVRWGMDYEKLPDVWWKFAIQSALARYPEEFSAAVESHRLAEAF